MPPQRTLSFSRIGGEAWEVAFLVVRPSFELPRGPASVPWNRGSERHAQAGSILVSTLAFIVAALPQALPCASIPDAREAEPATSAGASMATQNRSGTM